MLKKCLILITIFALSLPLFFTQGCAYAKIKAPFDDDVNQTKLGSKVGKASIYSILWMVSWGDSSTSAAASNGNITTINHLDTEYFTILFGMFAKVTTVAYGD